MYHGVYSADVLCHRHIIWCEKSPALGSLALIVTLYTHATLLLLYSLHHTPSIMHFSALVIFCIS